MAELSKGDVREIVQEVVGVAVAELPTRRELKTIEKQITELPTRVEVKHLVETAVGELVNAVAEGFNSEDERFDKVDANIHSIESEILDLKYKFSEMAHRAEYQYLQVRVENLEKNIHNK